MSFFFGGTLFLAEIEKKDKLGHKGLKDWGGEVQTSGWVLQTYFVSNRMRIQQGHIFTLKKSKILDEIFFYNCPVATLED